MDSEGKGKTDSTLSGGTHDMKSNNPNKTDNLPEGLDKNITVRDRNSMKQIPTIKKEKVKESSTKWSNEELVSKEDKLKIIRAFKTNEELKNWLIWSEIFKSQHKLEKHVVEIHFIPPTFVCGTWNSPYFRKKAYYYHLKIHKKENDKVELINKKLANQLPLISDINFTEKHRSQSKANDLGPMIKKRMKTNELSEPQLKRGKKKFNKISSSLKPDIPLKPILTDIKCASKNLKVRFADESTEILTEYNESSQNHTPRSKKTAPEWIQNELPCKCSMIKLPPLNTLNPMNNILDNFISFSGYQHWLNNEYIKNTKLKSTVLSCTMIFFHW